MAKGKKKLAKSAKKNAAAVKKAQETAPVAAPVEETAPIATIEEPAKAEAPPVSGRRGEAGCGGGEGEGSLQSGSQAHADRELEDVSQARG